MILITIIRASNLLNRNPLSTWQYIWLYLEACIATIMASITAFRTLFVQRSSADKKQKAAAAAAAAVSPPSPYYSNMREWLLRKIGRWKSLGGGWEEMSSGQEKGAGSGEDKDLPQVPSATMTGLRTFIYRNGRTVDEESVVRSGFYTFDEEDQTFHETMQWEVYWANLNLRTLGTYLQASPPSSHPHLPIRSTSYQFRSLKRNILLRSCQLFPRLINYQLGNPYE